MNHHRHSPPLHTMNLTALQNKSRALTDAAPRKVTFVLPNNSKVFTGIKRETKVEIKYADFGSQPGVSYTIIAEFSDFTTLPADRTAITVDGVAQQIVMIEKDPQEIKVFLHIGDVTA